MDLYLSQYSHSNVLERTAIESESLVTLMVRVKYKILESRCLGVQRKVGGKLLLKLNICRRPIVNKYREGKMKRTLKRELKAREIDIGEAVVEVAYLVRVFLRRFEP